MKFSNKYEPLVSLIVTTRNEEANISNCLKSIELQVYKNIEIIVVDNHSTDATKEIARNYTDAVVDMGPERSAQRNHGICDLATGFYAMFIDADMVLSPTLVHSCIERIRKTNAVALHVDEVVLGTGLLAKIRRFERSFYSGTVIDGARFFARKIFCEIGGFDVNLPPGPEDWDLDKRLKQFGNIDLIKTGQRFNNWDLTSFIERKGVKIDPSYAGIYHNESQQSLSQYLNKKGYYSSSMSAYIEKWGADDDVKLQLGLTYRFVGVFIENGKWKKLAQNPMKTLVMLSLRVAVGIVYLRVRVRSFLNTTKQKTKHIH